MAACMPSRAPAQGQRQRLGQCCGASARILGSSLLESWRKGNAGHTGTFKNSRLRKFTTSMILKNILGHAMRIVFVKDACSFRRQTSHTVRRSQVSARRPCRQEARPPLRSKAHGDMARRRPRTMI